MAIEKMKKIILLLPRERIDEILVALGTAGIIALKEATLEDIFGFEKFSDPRLAEIRALKTEAEELLRKLGESLVFVECTRLPSFAEIKKRLTEIRGEVLRYNEYVSRKAERENIMKQVKDFEEMLKMLGISLEELLSFELFSFTFGIADPTIVESLETVAINKKIVEISPERNGGVIIGIRLPVEIDGTRKEETIFAIIAYYVKEKEGAVSLLGIIEQKFFDSVIKWLTDRGYSEQKDILQKIKKLEELKGEEFEFPRVEVFKERTKLELSKIIISLSIYELLAVYASKALVRGPFAILIGWIPERYIEKAKKLLRPFRDVVYFIKDPEPHEEPPVMLRNPSGFRVFESFTRQYGYPNPKRREIDPTKIISILWLIMFGLMFPDFGQGLALVIMGILFKKYKDKVKKVFGLSPRVGDILIMAGTMAAIFGLLIGEMFLMEGIIHPLWPGLSHRCVASPDYIKWILKIAVFFGLFQLSLGYMLAMYINLRARHKLEAFFGMRGLAGLLALWGLAGTGFAIIGIRVFPKTPIDGPIDIPVVDLKTYQPLSFAYPDIYLTVPLLMLIASLIMMLIKAKLAGEGLMEWFAEALEVLLSGLSNTISYARIAVFAITHTVLAIVVTELLKENLLLGIVLGLGFLNAFCILLESVVVIIQATRLIYYEFLTKFYEGSGKPFKPIVIPHMKLLKESSAVVK